MGVVANIGFEEYPKQSDWNGKRVVVYFRYDTEKTIEGRIVRCDMESPGVSIIRLDDGRFILSSECQYQVKENKNGT